MIACSEERLDQLIEFLNEKARLGPDGATLKLSARELNELLWVASTLRRKGTPGSQRMALQEVVEFCWSQVIQGRVIDHGLLQDRMVCQGILVSVPANGIERAEMDVEEVYVPVWSKRAKGIEP